MTKVQSLLDLVSNYIRTGNILKTYHYFPYLVNCIHASFSTILILCNVGGLLYEMVFPLFIDRTLSAMISDMYSNLCNILHSYHIIFPLDTSTPLHTIDKYSAKSKTRG